MKTLATGLVRGKHCLQLTVRSAFRWQRWVLLDEEGPPAVPWFESDDGEVNEEQFITGLALDFTNTERLTLIAGEEKFPPSPVVWALTSHGSLLGWTVIHKKAPTSAPGAYAFMRTAEEVPRAAGHAVPVVTTAAAPAGPPSFMIGAAAKAPNAAASASTSAAPTG